MNELGGRRQIPTWYEMAAMIGGVPSAAALGLLIAALMQYERDRRIANNPHAKALIENTWTESRGRRGLLLQVATLSC